jgi:ribonuclease Z
MVNLNVTFLGTRAALPSKKRGLTGMAIQIGTDSVLIDAGDGALRQAVVMGIDLDGTSTILITHLHGDHVAGLFGLLWGMSLGERTKPLTIVAPPTLASWLDATCELLKKGLRVGFRVKFVPARQGNVLRTSTFSVAAEKANHIGDCYAYVVQERQVPYRRVGYSGDTRPSGTLSSFFHGCDLLIFDSTYCTADQALAIRYKHSTSAEAATLAAKARVKRLVLTHFSTKYASTTRPVKEARLVFPNVLGARDGLRLEIRA